MRIRTEPTQEGNPYNLVVNQHVFPKKSIERFAIDDGLVDVARPASKNRFRQKPSDALFCERRAWNNCAENGYMKKIEDSFQNEVESILENNDPYIGDDACISISRFYALWHMRSRRRHLDQQFISSSLPVSGDHLSKDQLEILEKNGYMAFYKDGRIASRHLNAVAIYTGMAEMLHGSLAGARWGVIIPLDGEFCVPDIPEHGIIPVTPTVALILNSSSGHITEENLGLLNRSMTLLARDYIFARSFGACPGIAPLLP